jgi:3,4-dihydroxy 2-butanone 4-phosphate synthase/GTP cyclohydrolase II
MDAPFSPIADILDDLRMGRMVILCDDEDRENEGDLVCAAEKVTPEIVNFMLKYGRGLLCLTLTRDRCLELNLPPQAAENTTQFGTNFTISIDAVARHGVTTGVSANDRATTILTAVRDDANQFDFSRPGHISPIAARDGGVLVRAGQTEGSVDLARLAGLKPAGVLIEIMNDDGTMARVPDLVKFSSRHGVRMCTVAALIEYRLQREKLVTRGKHVRLPTRWGEFTCIPYKTPVEPRTQVAMCMGNIGQFDESGQPIMHQQPVLARVHSECLTGDVFGSERCECGEQLHQAMSMIAEEGRGVLVYLRQEGRGIGLGKKLEAYHLQDNGFDTVEANVKLGFPPDKRDYGVGSQILRDLGCRKLRILTNNPKKISRLKVYGLEIVEQLPLQIPPNPNNEHYLRTKREKLGHMLE